MKPLRTISDLEGDLSPNHSFQLKPELGRGKGPNYILYYKRQ